MRLPCLDTADIQIRVRAGQPANSDAADGDFLDQFLVVRVQRVQSVDLVVFGLVRGGVAEDEQRIEGG